MTDRVLITGVTGFAGSYLAEYLLSSEKPCEVYGTYLAEQSIQNIASVKEHVTLYQVDLTDEQRVHGLIHTVKPTQVFHLAALASPADSFKEPLATIMNNVSVQIHLLEALWKAELVNTRVLVVSSADVYGIVRPEDLPIDEDTPFQPTNPYAVSKLTQDMLGLQYVHSYKLPIVRVRPFNHIGPRQSPSFVVASFAQKIARIEKGEEEPVLRVGNIETKRDFTDVRDMVVAYDLALEKGTPGAVYNIGSGNSYKIADIIDKLLSFASVAITVKIDETLFRPSDTPELVCDPGRFSTLTNWKPTHTIDETLKATLDYWRSIV